MLSFVLYGSPIHSNLSKYGMVSGSLLKSYNHLNDKPMLLLIEARKQFFGKSSPLNRNSLKMIETAWEIAFLDEEERGYDEVTPPSLTLLLFSPPPQRRRVL